MMLPNQSIHLNSYTCVDIAEFVCQSSAGALKKMAAVSMKLMECYMARHRVVETQTRRLYAVERLACCFALPSDTHSDSTEILTPLRQATHESPGMTPVPILQDPNICYLYLLEPHTYNCLMDQHHSMRSRPSHSSVYHQARSTPIPYLYEAPTPPLPFWDIPYPKIGKHQRCISKGQSQQRV